MAIWRLFLGRIEGVLRVDVEEVVDLEIPLWEVSQRTRLSITGSKVGPDDKVLGRSHVAGDARFGGVKELVKVFFTQAFNRWCSSFSLLNLQLHIH